MKIFKKILILHIVANLIVLSCCKYIETDSNSITSILVSTTAETTKIKETVPTTQKINYILNISIGKFHYSNCPSIDLMSEENKLYYSENKEDLLEYGYSPYGRCNP